MTELQYIYNTSNARFTIPVTDMTSIKKVEFKLSYQNASPSTNQDHIFKLGGNYGDFVLRKFQGQFDIYWYNITGIVPNPQPVTDEIITCTYDIANSVCTWNGTDYPLSGTQQYASDTTMYIGGNDWLLTVYYFKMWDASDNLLHHFVGCDNNGTVGINDKVTGNVYTPTTGTWLAGPQIKVPTDLVIGNKTVDSIAIGGKDVVSIYDGATLLWERPVTPQPTPPIISNCVCFEAVEPNARVSLQPSTNYSHFTVNLYYSTDGGTTFSPMVRQQPITLSNIGDKVYIYGENTTLAQTETNYVRLYVDGGDASVSGDLTRLLDANGLSTLPNRALIRTFSNCSHLVDASGLTIPVTSVGERSLEGLFEDCSGLVTPPTTLPATTLGEACYEEMFSGCSSLTSAPTLPATNLTVKCYNRMFYGCSSLTTAPVLSATTMMSNCYAYMFTDCTSLQTAPVLNALTLVVGCYGRMFYGCTSLNSVTCLATDISANGCLTQWMYNVAATGTFTKNSSMSNWTTGVDGIPTGWTVVDAQ